MYLRELLIRNNGPIRDLHLEFAFAPGGNPLPHVIVGRNGTGKTNLLSQIADALMEGAASVYSDVLTSSGLSRNWFRMVGGRTTTYGEETGFSILRFEHSGESLFFSETSGLAPDEQLRASLPETLASAVSWNADSTHSKNFSIAEKTVRDIYPHGVYAFFPSSRSEIPHWLNQAAVGIDKYETTERYSQNLGKSFFIEHGITDFTQWLLGVLTESREPIELGFNAETKQIQTALPSFNMGSFLSNQAIVASANAMLSLIMGEPGAHFYWAGRRSNRKVGVAVNRVAVTDGLDSLSGGQATLLALFGTILMHGDGTKQQLPNLAEGVVVIDELDAHMHIDLQVTALPELISLFPNVQFIITSHSPFFTLGMEKKFGADGMKIIELPSGISLTAEAYSDFENALEALRNTRAFENEISDYVVASNSPLVLVGGPTDVKYFNTAAKLLNFPKLVGAFECVGKPDENGGSNSGDGNLTSAIKFLQANERVTARRMVALYDCDAKNVPVGNDRIPVIKLSEIADRKMDRGVENLIPDYAFSSEMWRKQRISGSYAEEGEVKKFQKTLAAEMICGEKANAEHFADFRPVLERISTLLFPADDGEPSQPTSTGDDSGTNPSSPATEQLS